MQQRTDDAPINPSSWSCFGGGVEEGESPIEALIRELMEELEYRVKKIPYFFLTLPYQHNGDEYLSFNFLEEFDETQTETIVLHEGQRYDWFTIEEALKLPMSDNRRKVLKQAREEIDYRCDSARSK